MCFFQLDPRCAAAYLASLPFLWIEPGNSATASFTFKKEVFPELRMSMNNNIRTEAPVLFILL